VSGRRAARTAAPALAALALAALPGCGGGDEEAYGTAVNAFCTDVRASLRGFERDASAAGSAGDSETAARAFGAAVERLSTGLRRSTGALRDADAPEQYARFDAAAVRGFEEAARRLDGVAASARAGDMDALRDIDRRLGDLDVPAAPRELRRSAPACRSS
jgi:hypothetical protein